MVYPSQPNGDKDTAVLLDLISELVEGCALWDEHRDYYVNTFIPGLQSGTIDASDSEKTLIRKIQLRATAEEWERLPELALQVANERVAEAQRARQKVNEGRQRAREEAHERDQNRKEQERIEALRFKRERAEQVARQAEAERVARIEHRLKQALARSLEEADALNSSINSAGDICYATLRGEQVAENARKVRIAEEKRIAKIERQLKQALARSVEEADALNLSINSAGDICYATLRAEQVAENARKVRVAEEKRRRDEIRARLSKALEHSVSLADDLNAHLNADGAVDYSAVKTTHLESWLKKALNKDTFSQEQIISIGEMSQPYLLRARAGSGKTRVVVTKAALLMGHERVPPDQLMILAFNRKAAAEATSRVRKDLGIIDFNNARTFHSLAYQLVQPKGELLFDENTGSTKKQSQFVQGLLNSVLNPAILAQIYFFFRKEMRELEDIGTFLSEEDYYTYRRNHVQESLGGQHVKSIGEKWIADFLFEHDIRYSYEHVWFWDQGGGNYQPDFSLVTTGKRHDIIIEHWGIDLNDPYRQVPADWDQTWDEYRQQIDRKREYWDRKNAKNREQPVQLLETSIRDLRDGREVFEQRLAGMLSEAGVELRRLSDEELQDKVVRSRIGRFSTMCLQYIQKAKKQRLDPEQMANKISSQLDLDMRTKSFLRVANNLYRRYQKTLEIEGKIDFDDLMEAAIKKVHETKGNCQVRVQDDRYVAMNELRWIMVDEYQDFSRLFYDLIDAIRTYNRSVRLFCVGDNWQAINAFAGSDLHYFDDFESWNKSGQVGDLQNNYRSAPEIVHAGNRFMQGKGKESIATKEDLAGVVKVCATDKIWIETKQGEEFAEARESDRRFETWIPVANGKRKVDSGMRIAKMLKQCHEILTRRDYDPKSKFAILSRIGQLGIGYPNLSAFKRKLKSTLTEDELATFGDFDSRVHCGTVHSFKGLEANVVILLGVNKRNFPKIHPDNELYSIFGVTPANVLAEEERLFYVAITRAEEELYLLTETNRESEFLERLGLPVGASRTASFKAAESISTWSDDFDDDIPF